ncbi:hypothetical protein VTI74DRAFT_4382 [Chaetomium olivicolor]
MNDHREIKACYNAVVTSTNQDHQQRYGNQFTWELAKHSVGEELVLYPAFEKPDPKQIKELLRDFQSMESKDPSYVPKLTELWCKLADHIEDEERYDLPALEAKLSPDQSQALSKDFSRTKKFVPSRSHPSTGEEAPFETVMGLLATPIDRLADMFRKFPEQPSSKPETAEIDTPLGPMAMLHD